MKRGKKYQEAEGGKSLLMRKFKNWKIKRNSVMGRQLEFKLKG